MPITFESKGSFKNTERFLNRMGKLDIRSTLEKYGAKGAAALRANTPVRSGQTAASWGYEVTKDAGGWTITWTNSDIENGFPVAIMLQYGHATGTGGWVQGYDYINPALKPIFDQISDDVWRVVKSA